MNEGLARPGCPGDRREPVITVVPHPRGGARRRRRARRSPLLAAGLCGATDTSRVLECDRGDRLVISIAARRARRELMDLCRDWIVGQYATCPRYPDLPIAAPLAFAT